MYEQTLKGKFDKRALIFLTTILENKVKMPDNIRIVTWNYDFQIELAGEHFVMEEFVRTPQGATKHSPPLAFYYPYVGRGPFANNEEFSIIHLNGIAGSFNANNRFMDNFFISNKPRDLNELCKRLKIQNEGNHLTFAWEYSHVAAKAIEYSAKIFSKTDILIIIGYSFPFFNREVDKLLMREFTRHSGSRKIYFQDPVNTGEFLRNQFSLGQNVEIQPFNKVNNYFLPMEL